MLFEPLGVHTGGTEFVLCEQFLVQCVFAADLDGEIIAIASANQRIPSARHIGISAPTTPAKLGTAYQQARRPCTKVFGQERRSSPSTRSGSAFSISSPMW